MLTAIGERCTLEIICVCMCGNTMEPLNVEAARKCPEIQYKVYNTDLICSNVLDVQV